MLSNPLIDLTGKKVKTFTVLYVLPKENARKDNTKWFCVCECGAARVFLGACLRANNVRCACQPRKINTTHYLYATWKQMMQRCYDKEDKNFKNYGARGISVCSRWQEFKNFKTDMHPRPKGLTVDRIDNDGGYSPENCRWATPTDQALNRRSNRVIEHNGVELPVAEWERRLGLKSGVMHARLKRGFTGEKLFHKGLLPNHPPRA